MKLPLRQRLYQKARPLLYDLGLIRLMRRWFPKTIREQFAVWLGLEGFDPGTAPGTLRFRTPYSRGLRISADGLNLVGDLSADIGISEHTRLLLGAMRAVSLPVSYVEMPYDFRNRSNVIPDDLPLGVHHNITLIDVNFAQFREALIEVPRSALLNRYIIANWAYELPHFPEQWHDNFRLMHEIWVSTSYIQNVIGLVAPVPVIRMPIPIECSASLGATRAQFALPDDKYIFLFSFSVTSTAARKNPFAVIESFRRAFGTRGRSNALLVIKTHHMNLPDGDGLRDALYKAVASVEGIVIDDNLSRQQMYDLIALSDCYVSLHRAEGFGLGMAEAMALGKPVIATAYSGNMDYMNPGNSFGVRASIRPITAEDHRWQPQLIHLYPPGNVWGEPDIDHAASLMTYVFENSDASRSVGMQAADDIRSNYSRAVIGTRILERLRAINRFTNNGAMTVC